jgi:GntR family transcriptional repressor for pyruvate dehydrogenase complex
MNVTKLGQQILQSLCLKIFYGEIPENGKLPSIRDLAIEYKASTVIIREAVIVLETLGIVQIEHGKGVFLVQPDSLIEQIFNTRRELEKSIISDVAQNIGKSDLAYLKEQVSSMDKAAKPYNISDSYGQFDALFHGRIISLGRNFIAGRFLSMIRSAIYTPGIYRSNMLAQDPDYLIKSNKLHWEMYYALEAKDPEMAIAASGRHEDRVRKGWKRSHELWLASEN